MTIATPFIIAWMLVLFLKAYHAIAVIRWLLRRGPSVARAAGSPDRSVKKNQKTFWREFENQVAVDKSRFLIFGVKDIRITAAVTRHRKARQWIRYGVWRAIQTGWHMVGLVILTSALLVTAAYWPEHLSLVDEILLFSAGLFILLGMFLLGVEMVVLVVTLGPWLPYFHRLKPNDSYLKADGKVRETMRMLYVSAGASLITLLAMAGVLCFASRRTDALPAVNDAVWLGILQSLARSVSVLGTVGDGLDFSTVYGALLTIVLLPLVLTYIAFLVPIASSVVNVTK